ncbi:hypothetical protein TNCV_2440671 [Trichonephila clavipes]|nr:hypothetical protein TNCV_2440671 [Trichonephila clavipes]
MKLNKIANDERSGLSPSQTENLIVSALTNKLEEINLRVGRLQEASSVTARKTVLRGDGSGRLVIGVYDGGQMGPADFFGDVDLPEQPTPMAV